MRNMLTMALLALALGVGLIGCSKGNDWTKVGDDDPQLVAAREEARTAFPDFLKAFKNRRPGDSFSVEVYYNNTEYVQLRVLKASQSEVTGAVDCYPQKVDLKKEQIITVPLTDMNVLSDWSVYTESGDELGGFVAAARTKLSRPDRGG